MTRSVYIAITSALLFIPSAVAAQTAQQEHADHAKGTAKSQTPTHGPPPKPAPPATPPIAAQTKPADEHAGHVMAAPPQAPSNPVPRAAVPPLTDEDRKAAFPEVVGHTLHDSGVNYWVLFDQLEGQAAGGAASFNWDSKGWVGGDVNRLWLRSEGAANQDGVADAEAHIFYGRAIARWWDLVAGVRQDFRPGRGQTWAAVGIQGLAPYWFEVEATGYLGDGGRTGARFEVEYELLFTNRLIAQPLIEIELYGQPDPQRGVGAGLSSANVGLRLRYEIRRELAPYLGVTWDRKFGETRDIATTSGKGGSSARVAFGMRAWF
jgi:copper resistance protein B